jgi:hypothetical protein
VRPTGELMPAAMVPAANVDSGGTTLPGDEGGMSPTAAGADARAPATQPPGSDPVPKTNED